MFRFDLISQAIAKEPNKFLLVHLLAKRAHQLADGATPLSTKSYESRFNTAVQEFLDGSIQFKEQDSDQTK
jgi:DNA-directed RNA polymerase subunit K/omega